MDANEPTNDHRNDSMARKHQRQTSGKGGFHFGQVSCGRRILDAKYQQRTRTTIPSSSVCTQNRKQNIRDVHLKDSTRMVVGRGILESELQIGDDVDGLILFPHQVAIRVMDVYASGVQKSNEDGQVLSECIGQILWWSRTFLEEMNMESQEKRSTSTTTAAFDVNEDILPEDTIRTRKMQDCKEEDILESMD